MVLRRTDIQGQNAEYSFQSYQQKSAAAQAECIRKNPQDQRDTLQGRTLEHCLYSSSRTRIRYLHCCDIQNFYSRIMSLKSAYVSALVIPYLKDKIIDESWI